MHNINSVSDLNKALNAELDGIHGTTSYVYVNLDVFHLLETSLPGDTWTFIPDEPVNEHEVFQIFLNEDQEEQIRFV